VVDHWIVQFYRECDEAFRELSGDIGS